jgi:diaminohydroxyphosphoribosylaminopyrimidine deaminase/5-amino-6-(5-phosphoribosylamino)uracil reductase
MTNQDAMRLAIELAKKGTGYVSPNPLVGAVILKDGCILSTGYHQNYGNIHAEKAAINNCSDADLIGSDIVVNLEPCSHTGKQPPCSDLLIEKKIKSVVIGMSDPNPLVSGNGIMKLRQAGIDVTTSMLEEECKWLNRFFSKHISSGMPYVIAKAAISLNGCIAYEDGNSKWISSEESRSTVHQLRHETDAVMIGKHTALIDNPELTVRLITGRNPYRIVFDNNLELPLNLKLFNDDNKAKTIIICSEQSASKDKYKILTDSGVQTLIRKTSDKLEDTFRELYSRFSIGSILVEGGSILHNALLANNMIDEIQLFVAPKIIANGLASFMGNFTSKKAINENAFKVIANKMSGPDIHLILVRS